MAKLLYRLEGVRGRSLWVYDTKCVIMTRKTLGSFLSGNFTDGEKTLFLKDVVGVQFKRSGFLIGYLQFETPSSQMNNRFSNMFSENTFTFAEGRNGVTNAQMQQVYNYIVNRLEELKYAPVMTEAAPIQETVQQEVPTPPKPKKEQPNKENREDENTWICGKCNARNLRSRNDCWSCGNKR